MQISRFVFIGFVFVALNGCGPVVQGAHPAVPVNATAASSAPFFGIAAFGAMPVGIMSAKPVVTTADVQGRLQAAGLIVNPMGPITQPFLRVPGKIFSVNGQGVQVYEYKNPEDAEADMLAFSGDGARVGTGSTDWAGPPHLYRNGKLIVIYVGESGQILTALTLAMGVQFAGR